jgi:hypothetical protein
VHGKPAANVLSADAYCCPGSVATSFSDYLLSGPAWPDGLIELINDRARDTGRTVDL